MPDREEVRNSLYGAWRLALMDQSGLAYFNLSFEGFWRSFFAPLLAAPGFAPLVVLKLAAWPEPLDPGWALLVQILAYGFSVAAFPLVAVVLIRRLGLTRHYVSLIVALNWATVVQAAIILIALLLSLALPGLLAGLITLLAVAGVLFYQWVVTRAALETTGGIALMLLLVDLVLDRAIEVSADWLI